MQGIKDKLADLPKGSPAKRMAYNLWWTGIRRQGAIQAA